MRRLLVFIMTIYAANLSATQIETLWEKGNNEYANGDYRMAILYYDSISMQGLESSRLYYNLANAYFKDNKIGKSILYYNRALILNPSNSDIRYNLAVVNTYTKDKIDVVPEFFLLTWVRSLRLFLSANTWAVISLTVLAIGLLSTLFYLLSGKTSLRKIGFFLAISMFVLFGVSLTFSTINRHQKLNSSVAIVMRSAVPVKSSPNSSGKDIFIIHEGLKVKITNSLNDWYEISLADGNKGWIERNALEVI